MAKFYNELNQTIRDFIDRQKVFFTATAPKSGRINLSPKGMDTFRCIDDHTVAYLDLTGSGNETAAHLLDDGRITIMFCSFDKKPLILRLYGTGHMVQKSDEAWADLIQRFPEEPGVRQIMVMTVQSAQTSCGWAVPFAENQQERAQLRESAEKGEKKMLEYRKKKNHTSIDGLPTGLPR